MFTDKMSVVFFYDRYTGASSELSCISYDEADAFLMFFFYTYCSIHRICKVWRGNSDIYLYAVSIVTRNLDLKMG